MLRIEDWNKGTRRFHFTMFLARMSLFLLFAVMSNKNTVDAHYLPGVAPRSFKLGDPVDLKVNKMTSGKTLFPVDYYHLPYCQPKEGVRLENMILGEFLAGDRIENSPYMLNMKVDSYCQQLCIADLGTGRRARRKFEKAILWGYHNNWIVDNLPAAYKTTRTTRYWRGGFPVGSIRWEDWGPELSLHNHVNIEIMYHPVAYREDAYRIVRFAVQPFSIKHEFENMDGGGEVVAKIKNPIASCRPNANHHTDYDMVTHNGTLPQEPSGQVLFTYDVKWTQTDDIAWAHRWDIYLTMNNTNSIKYHWMAFAQSLIFITLFSTLIAIILVRNLRHDLARYNRLATDEETTDDGEDKGWKLVHADVFRPPSCPLALSVAMGTGAQLLGMTFWVIIFAAAGHLSSARRGALVTAQLIFYVLMGVVGGYVSAKFYKTFKGKASHKATAYTAFGFPGACFACFLVMDVMACSLDSTYAASITTMFVLLILWIGISTPLVVLGARLGYKGDGIEFPVGTSNVPRQIPDQPWSLGFPCTMLYGGIIPLGVCHVEVQAIMQGAWKFQHYYLFGFLFLIFFALIITCAQITVFLSYIHLCKQNYHWWWRSFWTAGSIGIWMFLYSIVYFRHLEAKTFSAFLLYFGSMCIYSFGLFLMTGFIGVISTLWFNKTIFGSISAQQQDGGVDSSTALLTEMVSV